MLYLLTNNQSANQLSPYRSTIVQPLSLLPPPIITRSDLFHNLSKVATWDILVIGGGATGLGIALDAVGRGYKTLLVEQADFAKGTSSRSTKLIHGGVRYLAQGNIKLVREASIERGILLRNAPHLTKIQTFIVPVYSFADLMKYGIGLGLYDRIAGKFRLGSSRLISRKETIARMPNLRCQGLKGGIVYHDGQFDDARLAISLVRSIQEYGGTAINYTKLKTLLKNEKGNICGATITDTENGKDYQVNAKVIINATGIFVDEILKMDNASNRKSICVSQGTHIVLDKRFSPKSDALMIPKTSDGRVLFAVPWHDKLVVGTTDNPASDALLEPRATENEISFILETAGNYFIKKPQRSDILSVFSGLRPLAYNENKTKQTKEISRSHKIMVSGSGLFSIIGGKWTTYRRMGEEMINRVESECKWQQRPSITATLPIHGYFNNSNWSDPFYIYGNEASFLKPAANSATNWLSEKLKIHHSHVEWAASHEMARTVEDVLSRRTRALVLDAVESVRIAPQVAQILAHTLNKDEKWANEQVINFTKLANQYMAN